MTDRLLSRLRASRLDGNLIDPGHGDYDAARRVWNGMADRRPAAIVRARSVADVRKVVSAAAEFSALLAVRGGGHSIPGLSTCDGGIVLDLSRMNAVEFDPDAGTAEVQGGALLGDLDRATVPLGRVVPAGVVSHTGVAGLTLGGGMGWLSRRFGLTVDSLIGAEMVTADGGLRHVDARREPDLFWAIRGGGGNFGVVTRFRFRTHDLGPVLIGTWSYPVAEGAEVLARFRDLAARAPRALTSGFTFTPDGLRVTAIWTGSAAGAEAGLTPFGSLGTVTDGALGRTTFLELQSRGDAYVAWHRRYYTKGGYFGEIDERAIARIVERIACAPTAPGGPEVEVYTIQLGGAVADLDDDATPYTGRAAGYYWIAQAIWDRPEDDACAIGWTRAAAAQLAEISMVGNYVNEQADFGRDVAVGAYGQSKYDRLASLKARYDPGNLFRLNQNIEPRR